MKIIFLDIDGVLNGYNRFTGVIFSILNKLHLLKYVSRHYDLFGVRTHKVKLLKKIINKTGAKVVLSSSWRNGWYMPYEENDLRQGALHNKFAKYGIEVIGITPTLSSNRRNDEIDRWLEEHEDSVESYIVIDDEGYYLHCFEDKLILTSRDGDISGAWYENTGLKRHHVRQAIKQLNKV